MDAHRQGLVLLLLRENNRAEAVRLYQKEADVSHFDACKAVADLAQRHGIASPRQTLAALLGILALLIGLLLAF